MSTSGIPASRDGFARWCEAEGIHTVVAGAADTHGIWRGKRLGVADFLAKIDHGIPFSDVVLVLTHSEDTDEGQELVEPPDGAAYRCISPARSTAFRTSSSSRTWARRGGCRGIRARSACSATITSPGESRCRSTRGSCSGA